MQIVDRVEIPSGLVHTFTICGVVMEIALALLLLNVAPWILLHHLWSLIPSVPVWLFFVYHSRKEPRFFKFWIGQILCKDYYHG